MLDIFKLNTQNFCKFAEEVDSNIDFLPKKIDKIEISHKNDKKVLEIQSSDLNNYINNYESGRIIEESDRITIKLSVSKQPIILYGVHLNSNVMNFFSSSKFNYVYSYNYSHYGVPEEEITYDNKCVEIVAGLNKNSFNIWPSSGIFKSNSSRSYDVTNGIDSISFNESESGDSYNKNSVFFKIEDVDVCLSLPEKGGSLGYILFSKFLSSESRRKIRTCLSYLLGSKINLQGYKVFDSNDKTIAVHEYSHDYTTNKNNFFDVPTKLSEENFNALINYLYNNFDDLNLSIVLNNYIAASSVSLDKAPVYYGSAIEALQKSYVENNYEKISTRIIDKNLFKESIVSALESFKSLDGISDEDISLLIGNISSKVNVYPQKLILRKVFNYLNLELTEREMSAWQSRNDAAHGNSANEINITELLYNNFILRCMLNRMILRITGQVDTYIDYSTIGYPEKDLASS